MKSANKIGWSVLLDISRYSNCPLEEKKCNIDQDDSGENMYFTRIVLLSVHRLTKQQEVIAWWEALEYLLDVGPYLPPVRYTNARTRHTSVTMLLSPERPQSIW